MKVEVWSDFACPFCYIGKQRLEAAIDQFAHKDNVEVVFRSFELDPNAQRDVDYDVHDMLTARYGMSREQAIAMNENLGNQAKEAGLAFQFDTMILTNTFDAHRLAQYASKQGKMNPMAQSTDMFLHALQTAWNESQPLTALNDSGACADGQA